MTNTEYNEANQALWDTFVHVISARRAIRDFSDRPIEAEDLNAILGAAVMAPSSMGMQPYELHVVLTPSQKSLVAEACNGQRAARSSAVLVAVVVGPSVTKRRIREAEEYYQQSPLPERSREYHLKGVGKLSKATHWALQPFLASAGIFLNLFQPARGFLPLGPRGLREWGARNAMLAAQNLMLAASARGLDSCPMEGFDGVKIARLLDLPRGSAVAVMVALGYRANDALIEPQWRRNVESMEVRHLALTWGHSTRFI